MHAEIIAVDYKVLAWSSSPSALLLAVYVISYLHSGVKL